MVRAHHQDQKLRKMTRSSQFVRLGLAQLAGRVDLRDVVSNLKAQAGKLYPGFLTEGIEIGCIHWDNDCANDRLSQRVAAFDQERSSDHNRAKCREWEPLLSKTTSSAVASMVRRQT